MIVGCQKEPTPPEIGVSAFILENGDGNPQVMVYAFCKKCYQEQHILASETEWKSSKIDHEALWEHRRKTFHSIKLQEVKLDFELVTAKSASHKGQRYIGEYLCCEEMPSYPLNELIHPYHVATDEIESLRISISGVDVENRAQVTATQLIPKPTLQKINELIKRRTAEKKESTAK